MLDLQRDALVGAGIRPNNIYEEKASGTNENRPVLTACLKALRKGDTLIVWKFDRLGRNLKHLVDTAQDLATRGIGFKVLTGQGANIDTTTASGKLVFGIFAALAEFERELSGITRATLTAMCPLKASYVSMAGGCYSDEDDTKSVYGDPTHMRSGAEPVGGLAEVSHWVYARQGN